MRPAAWSVAELVAIVAAQLVLTPLLLQRLGIQQFAVWVVVQSALMASPTLSLGAGTALLPTLAGAWSRHDARGAWAAIRFFVSRTAVMSVAGLAAIALAFVVWPSTASPIGLTREALAIIAASALLWISASEFDSGFSAALKAIGRFDTVARMEVASRLLQVTLTWAAVTSGAEAVMPVLLAAALTVARAGCKYAVLRSRWPRPACAESALGAEPLTRQLSSAGAWLWIGMLSGIVFYAFDRWFVGAYLGSQALAAYAVCSQIAQLPHAFVSAAGQTLVPWAGRRSDRIGNLDVRRSARTVMLWAATVAALPAAVLLVLLEPLLELWISAEFAAEHLALARGLTVVSLLLCLNVPSYFMLLGFGRVRALTLLGALAATAFVAGCYLTSPTLTAVVVLRGMFAVFSLGLVVYFLRTVRFHQ